MRRFTPRTGLAAALLGALVVTAACDSPTNVATETSDRIAGPLSFHIIPPTNPELEWLVLCKAGPAGTYTFEATATHPVLLNTSTGAYNQTSATYTITVAEGSTIDGTTVPGACLRHSFSDGTGTTHNHNALAGGGTDARITVIETGVPAGTAFQKAVVYQKTKVGSAAASTTITETTVNSATGRVGGDGLPLASRTLWGASIIFHNIGLYDLTVEKTAAGTFDRSYSWDLTKSVSPTSHTGTAGQDAGSSTWTVTATRSVVDNNFQVTGTITITNPNGFAVDVSVADQLNDGTSATVECPLTGTSTGTVPANGTLTCSYSASPSSAAATLNTATVTVTDPETVQGGTATAAVAFTPSVSGDASVTLADPRFTYSQVISGTTTVTFPETFPCPSDASQYTNGVHTRTETNTATLTGDNTNLSRNAEVEITCTMQGNGETATGAGFPWAATQGAPSNWFMYTPWSTTSGYRGISAAASGSTPAGTNLIAGQHYVAGRITGTRGSTANSTSITITLASGWSFAPDSDNVKIYPMSCTTKQPYVQPGGFTVKRTALQSATSITVTGLANTACYGIHVDVLH